MRPAASNQSQFGCGLRLETKAAVATHDMA
jgi:hypothetical protein